MATQLQRCGLLVAIAVLCPLANQAAAQSDNGPVPRDLVVLLLHQLGEGTNNNGGPIITSGLSPAVETRIGAPPGGTIVGTVSWPLYSDVVGTAPGTVDAVRQWFGADFVKRGYTVPDGNAYMTSMGGFRDPTPTAASAYCVPGGGYLTTTVRPHDMATVEFRVRVQTNSGPCASQAMRPSFVDPSVLPLLYNPPTAQQASRCYQSSAGGGPQSTSARLSTTIAPADLLKHYAQQLETAGWKPAPLASPVTGNWIKKDSTGHDITVTLTVTPIAVASDCRMVNMSVTQPNR